MMGLKKKQFPRFFLFLFCVYFDILKPLWTKPRRKNYVLALNSVEFRFFYLNKNICIYIYLHKKNTLFLCFLFKKVMKYKNISKKAQNTFFKNWFFFLSTIIKKSLSSKKKFKEIQIRMISYAYYMYIIPYILIPSWYL